MLEFIATVVGIAVAAALWNTPARMLRVAGCAAFLLAVLLGALAITGWPSYRARLHQTEAIYPELRQAHSVAGHHSTWVVALALPLLIGAAVRRRSSLWRKSLHLAIAFFFVAAWLLVSFSAYLLPGELPDPLPADLAPPVLRFALLHMLVMPALLGVALLIVGWRHFRGARQVPVV